MSSRFSHTSGLTKLVIIVEFLLVAFLLYSLTKNVYDGYKVDQYIETFNQENVMIEEENRQMAEDYLYFTSEEYIDKIAKQNLGVVNSGEKVLILSSDIVEVDDNSEQEDLSDYYGYTQKSKPNQWMYFFFGE